MLEAKRRIPTLLLSAVLLAGCDQEIDPTGPRPAAVPPAAGGSSILGAPWTLDSELLALARDVPGFGGLFSSSADVVTVYLTDPSRSAGARAPIQAFLTRGGRETATLRFVQGEYTFPQLAGWYRQLVSGLEASGITVTDIDDRRNRLLVGVMDAGVRDRVLAAVAGLGIPAEAVIVEEIPPAVIEASVQGTVRPVVGGVQIQSSAGTCTLGWNAIRFHTTDPFGQVDFSDYFITNSHCTDQFGVVMGLVMGQPTTSSPIGTEFIDPPLFTSASDSRCPSGRECRYSDAALFQYYDGIDKRFAYFARTYAGSLTIQDYVKLLSSDAPTIVGDPANKTGRSTGTTYGTITQACADQPQYERDPWGNVVDTGRTMLCQGRADYSSQGGDSGSPVFFHIYEGSPPQSYPTGVHWGSGAFFSPIENVKRELSTSDWRIHIW